MPKILSSNIRFDNPKDKEHTWSSRLPVLAKIINSCGLDILGTQEGRRPQLLELSQKIPSLKMVQDHRRWIDDRMYPCIFFNPATVTIIDSGDIWLSETPNIAGSFSFKSAFPRLAVWAICKLKNTSTKFIYLNTHLDHVHANTREQQINVLLNELIKINLKTLPVILSGDFNESPFKEVRTKINFSLPSITDPWIKKGYEEESTFHKFKGKLSKADGGARIDWILLDKSFSCEQIKIIKYKQNEIYPSDHFPILCEFN